MRCLGVVADEVLCETRIDWKVGDLGSEAQVHISDGFARQLDARHGSNLLEPIER